MHYIVHFHVYEVLHRTFLLSPDFRGVGNPFTKAYDAIYRILARLLETGLPLFTELPSRVLLGNSAYLTREEGCPAVAKARRESGSTTNTVMRSATTSSTALRTRTPTVAPTTTPGAPARRLSTQTMMVPQKLHAFIIHNPAATTRPTMPSTKAV